MMYYDLEKYRDSLSIVKTNNSFLDLTKVSIDELESYINHKVWIRQKIDDRNFAEFIYTLKSIDKELKKIYFKDDIEVNYEDLIGIEDLDINFNECNIDNMQMIGQKVKITNKYGNFIECAIQDIDDFLIYFAVRLADYKTLSYDLSYPINLIKKIEIL